MDEMQKRALKVIASIPSGDKNAFKALVKRAAVEKKNDGLAREVCEILLGGIDSWAACRFFPEEMISLTNSKLLLLEKHLKDDEFRRWSSTSMGPFFGIQPYTKSNFHPASSLRGPFLPLLRFHPGLGVDFIIALLNHAGLWYRKYCFASEGLEPVHSVTIEIPGEDPVIQWANHVFWGQYRGRTIGPYEIQSALMALEKWLLDFCEFEPVELESWLLRMLRESNNVMVTAVVASFCNAFPEKAGRAGVALLSSRDLFLFDRSRIVQDRGKTSMPGIFPNLEIERIYVDERKKSDTLPHRGDDLEALAVKLQQTERREEVCSQIDRHRAGLPLIEEQTKADRLWRLALHRMDIRGYRLDKNTGSGESSEDSTEGQAPSEQQFNVVLGQVEEDIQELVHEHVAVAAQKNRHYSLLNWGTAAWESRETSYQDTSNWQKYLEKARALDSEPEPEDYLRGGPGMVAAVCVRDHWDGMVPEDRAWCFERLIKEVERNYDGGDHLIRNSGGVGIPDRAAAYVLPRALVLDVSEEQNERIRESIAKALTHFLEEVAMCAAEGLGYYSTKKEESFLRGCVAAIAAKGSIISKRLSLERDKPYTDQIHIDKFIREVVPGIRASIIDMDLDPEREIEGLDLSDRHGSQAACLILPILGNSPDSDFAIGFHHRIVKSLVDDWDQEHKDPNRLHQQNHELNYECIKRLSRFVLKLEEGNARDLCTPFISALENHPYEISEFLRQLVFEEDLCRGASPFWGIWQDFVDAICASPWVDQIDSQSAIGKELVGAIFLETRWKENVRRWHRLEDQGHRIDVLAERFLGSTTVFNSYCRFLHDIGETSLPKGFVILAKSLTKGDPAAMLADKNTVYFLESLLLRNVYAEPHRLKTDPTVQTALLAILDHLVERGSSVAYRMRDDFVTPPSPSETNMEC